MSCYITYVMLYNVCHVILRNMCHVMLYNMCYVMLCLCVMLLCLKTSLVMLCYITWMCHVIERVLCCVL